MKSDTGVLKLLYSRKEAAFALGLSARSLDYLIDGGHIDVRRIGSRVMVPAEELKRIAREGIRGSVAEAA